MVSLKKIVRGGTSNKHQRTEFGQGPDRGNVGRAAAAAYKESKRTTTKSKSKTTKVSVKHPPNPKVGSKRTTTSPSKPTKTISPGPSTRRGPAKNVKTISSGPKTRGGPAKNRVSKTNIKGPSTRPRNKPKTSGKKGILSSFTSTVKKYGGSLGISKKKKK